MSLQPMAPAHVDAQVEPYNRLQDRYQAYYRSSLAAYCSARAIPFRETGAALPRVLRLLNRVRASSRVERVPGGPAVIDAAARLLGGRRGRTRFDGAYVVSWRDAEVKVAIDAWDSGDVQAPGLLEWCDIYFKTNYWPSRAYPPKVVPLANLNPDVLPRLDHLRAARNTPKEWDLFAFFRVWGGSDEAQGVEHNLAIFEILARVKCRKKLLAYLVTGDTTATAARLAKAGIECTTRWMPMSELWRTAARSRLNIVRHGMHQCIPWRMTDTLAMGGCPVLDYPATTRWHAELEENTNYLNLGIPYRPNEAVDFDRNAVAHRVEAWLSRPEALDEIGRTNARYFDEHLAPERLGEYLLDRCSPG